MRQVILTILSIFAVLIFISTNTTLAEQNLIVFEMGESGQTVSFPAEPKDIAGHKVNKVDPEQGSVMFLEKSKAKFITFEMGEGGHIVSFLMTPEEIKAEELEENSLDGPANVREIEDSAKVFHELAESGLLIEFPADDAKVYPDNLARAVTP